MQHCILVKWTPDAGDKDALAKEAEDNCGSVQE